MSTKLHSSTLDEMFITFLISGVLLLGMASGSLFAQPSNSASDTDQTITFNAPKKIMLKALGTDDPTINYTAGSTQDPVVHTQDWKAFSNLSGSNSTKIIFDVDTFDHKTEDYYRDAKIDITSTDAGGWGDLSSKSATAVPGSSGSSGQASITITKGLDSPGNGHGGRPLNGTITMDILFMHETSDENPDTGNYVAPSGDWETEVTGTISAN